MLLISSELQFMMGKTAKERMQAYRARLNSDPVKRFSFSLLIYYCFIMDISATTNILIDDILKGNIISNKSWDICKKSVLTNQRNIAYHGLIKNVMKLLKMHI